MNKTQHTPGPWIFGPDPLKEIEGTFILDAKKTVFIARIEESPELNSEYDAKRHKGKNEMKANARLIAAAPELLEALKCLSDEVEMMCSLGSNPKMKEMLQRWTDAKQAIAKATEGRTNG